MHYYQFNIGDYSSHTKHLTPLEDICYRRLLDWYYLHEKPIPKDISIVTRMLMLNGCSTEVEQVLNEFFVSNKSGWINPRADKEIDAYHNKVLSSSRAGKISAEKRKTYKQQPLNEPSTDVQPTINHKPLTNKHKTDNKLTYELGIGWLNYENFLAKAEADFPYVDILKEFDKASSWIKENPSQRMKTDYNRFMLNWIKRVSEVTPNPNDMFLGNI
jgi:uncharacterized protein YdaU (DUF1376 family)